MVQTPQEKNQSRAKIEDKWAQMLAEAKRMKPGFVEPTVPYKPDHIVGAHNGLGNQDIILKM
jgi:hypothetical protein